MRGCLPFRKPGGELAERGVRALVRHMGYQPASTRLPGAVWLTGRVQMM